MTSVPTHTSELPADRVASRAQTAACDLVAGVHCTHCDLPVPRGLVEAGAEQQFCCDGCRTVFGIVHGHGLDRYYEMRRQLEQSKAKATPGARVYDEFDDPAFLERYAQSSADGTQTATLLLEGVHCAACVWLIEKLPRLVPGVQSCALDFRKSLVTVRLDPAQASLSAAARGLDALGYRCHPPRGAIRDRIRAAESRAQLARLGVAGALAGNTMLLGLALYAGMLEGISEPMRHTLRSYSALLGVLALAWPGRVFFVGAIGALRTRTPHLDLPIGLALAVGGAWGLWNTVQGTGEIYFDSLTALVFLLLVGRFLQHRQQRRAADALELLFTLTPTSVRLVDREDDQERVRTRPIEAAQAGDVCEVRPGETIPADGEVIAGRSQLDNALLTGESEPVLVQAGAEVHAGATNLRGVIRVQIRATGEDTRVGQLMRLVSDAAASKPGVVQLADRMAGWFVIVVGGLALGTGLVWSQIDPAHAIEHATALLIVTCPCALGLATPLVFTSSLGRLASRGVLVKGGAALERLGRVERAFVDKTGTLTTGSLRVTDWTGPNELRAHIAALEGHATHPIALALQGLEGDSPTVVADDIEQHDGLGITGWVAGQQLAVGSRRLLEQLNCAVPDDLLQWANERAARGQTPVFVARDGVAVAAASITGTLRPEAASMVESLQGLGLRVTMLTGDRADAAEAIAARVGLAANDVLAGVSPEGKLAELERAREAGGAVMIGDGVNDAGALAAADVGLAVAGGAEASLQAADVSLRAGSHRGPAIHDDAYGGSSLLTVPLAIRAARATRARVRLCLGVSLSYNAVAASLAVFGLIHPLLAAVLMPLSSLSVLGLAAMRPSWAKAHDSEQAAAQHAMGDER